MRLSLSLALLLTLAACAEPPPPAALTSAEAAERDSVLALLRTANTDAFDAAYARLGTMPFRVTTRTAQLDAEGDTTATHARTFRVTPDAAALVRADSSGDFDYGSFSSFADRRRAVPTFATNPADLVLGEPAYLDPRGTEVFSFALAGDTTLGDQPIRILTVTARPDEGDEQTLRAARFYLDADGALVGARVQRRQASVLFGETSRLTLFLRPADTGWLPDRLAVTTEIQAPLAAPRRFLLDERYAYSE